MDDDRSSQSIFEKNQVSIGYLCFYSMMRIMTADDKKLNTKGFNLSPSNSKKDLNELKKLWEKTIEDNAFNFIEN